jgi:hypothetical protein
MITPHPRLKVNVAKLAASIVAAAHQHLRISSEPMNRGCQSAASAFFNNLLVSAHGRNPADQCLAGAGPRGRPYNTGR